MKYDIPDDQNEILPNLLGLAFAKDIAISEFEGFLRAEVSLTDNLSARTKFNLTYISKIHKTALGHLYSFAGKYRDVNISKGGFPFAAARYLPETMKSFEDTILKTLPNKYETVQQLIMDIAKVHGELLLIHPFREGNGRTARILANLMCRKQGYSSLDFNKIGAKEFDKYVFAVQKCADKDYSHMEKFINLIFPD